MNGWLLVRIVGIVVGIATLLRVAANEKLVTFDPLFLAWMDRLRDIVELGFLTDLIKLGLDLATEWVRSLGISLPDLQDEWRPAFVFSMLMFATIARHSRRGFLVAAAPVVALVVAVWSGLVGNLNPVAASAFTVVGFAFTAAASSTVSALAAFVFTFGAVAAFFLATAGVLSAHGMVAVVAAVFERVAGLGVLLLIVGIVEDWAGGWRAVYDNANFNTGIDILFTMAIAFVIAVAAANPPVW